MQGLLDLLALADIHHHADQAGDAADRILDGAGALLEPDGFLRVGTNDSKLGAIGPALAKQEFHLLAMLLHIGGMDQRESLGHFPDRDAVDFLKRSGCNDGIRAWIPFPGHGSGRIQRQLEAGFGRAGLFSRRDQRAAHKRDQAVDD